MVSTRGVVCSTFSILSRNSVIHRKGILIGGGATVFSPPASASKNKHALQARRGAEEKASVCALKSKQSWYKEGNMLVGRHRR